MTPLARCPNAWPLGASGFEMLIKIITLFLIFMAVLAMFGRLRFPGQNMINAAKCPTCGRPKIGRGRCPCAKE